MAGGLVLDSESVEIFNRKDELVIQKTSKNLAQAFELLTQLPDDFFADGRKDSLSQQRQSF